TQLARRFDQVPYRHSLVEGADPGAQRYNVGLTTEPGRNHGKACETALGRLRLVDNRCHDSASLIRQFGNTRSIRGDSPFRMTPSKFSPAIRGRPSLTF